MAAVGAGLLVGLSVLAPTIASAKQATPPGMITRAWRLLQENPDPTEEEVRFGMAGNLCRCTGYQNIVKAILAAAAELNAAREAAQ